MAAQVGGVEPTSLRERKKAHTRRSLIEASQRLFLEQGFAATTLEQVAEAVDVNVKTLLRYFPTKPDLALALEQQTLDRFCSELADPGRRLGVVEFYCDFVRGLAADWVDERWADRLAYLLLLDSEPTVAARSLVILRGYEDALAAEISGEISSPADFDLYAHAVAAMLVNGMNAIIRRWSAAPQDIDLIAALDALRDFCLLEFPTRTAATRLASTRLVATRLAATRLARRADRGRSPSKTPTRDRRIG